MEEGLVEDTTFQIGPLSPGSHLIEGGYGLVSQEGREVSL